MGVTELNSIFVQNALTKTRYFFYKGMDLCSNSSPNFCIFESGVGEGGLATFMEPAALLSHKSFLSKSKLKASKEVQQGRQLTIKRVLRYYNTFSKGHP